MGTLAGKENIVVFEVKIGIDRLFQQETKVAELIESGCFRETYFKSRDGGLFEENLLETIRMAKGNEAEAKMLAHGLCVQRWTVSEIRRGEKQLPLVEQIDPEKHTRKVSLSNALQSNHKPPKVDAAVALKGNGDVFTEVEFMYKPIGGYSKRSDKKYTLKDQLEFAKEMRRRVQEKLEKQDLMKAAKRFWKMVYVLECEHISLPLSWTDTLVELFSAPPAFAGEITAQMETFLRALKFWATSTEDEKSLQRLQLKIDDRKSSVLSRLVDKL